MTAFLYPISIFNMVKKSKGKDKGKKQRKSNKLLIFHSCCLAPTPTPTPTPTPIPIVPWLFALWHFPSKNSKDSFHIVYPKKQNNKIILFWFDNWLPYGFLRKNLAGPLIELEFNLKVVDNFLLGKWDFNCEISNY